MSDREDAVPVIATSLPQATSSARTARAFTRETLTGWQLAHSYEDVALVVNELVANAVLHGQGPITLSLAHCGNAVRIEVLDDSAALPKQPPPSDTRLGGRGLAIVSAIADDWGSAHTGEGGKSVWAEVSVKAS
jgi:anti-sigma regulatory factor (Ser/Thr protein kinase)